MSTIIDNLIVLLGLDAKPFKKGAKDVEKDLDQTKKNAKKTSADIERSGKQAAEYFNQMRNSAIKLFAVLTLGSGLVNFTRNVITLGASLDRVAKNLETTPSKLSRWGGAVRQSGGTVEGFLGSVQGLSAQLTQLKLTGDSGILPYIQALGVSLADVNGKARPFDDILLDISERLTAMPSRADAFNIGRNLGLDEGTVNLLLKGRNEVQKLLAAQREYSDADAKQARLAEESWERTKQRIERTTQALVIKMLPTLEKLAITGAKFAETVVPLLVSGFEKLESATGKWFGYLEKGFSIMQRIGEVSNSLFGGKDEKTPDGKPASTVAKFEDLTKKAGQGDRGAAREAAVMSLTTGMPKGYQPSEEMIEKRANVLMGPEGRRRAVGKVTDESPVSSMLGGGAGARPVMSGVSSGAPAAAGAGSLSIGQVNVYTQATDANGIARDMRGAIIRQADTGMR